MVKGNKHSQSTERIIQSRVNYLRYLINDSKRNQEEKLKSARSIVHLNEWKLWIELYRVTAVESCSRGKLLWKSYPSSNTC